MAIIILQSKINNDSEDKYDCDACQDTGIKGGIKLSAGNRKAEPCPKCSNSKNNNNKNKKENGNGKSKSS